MSVGLLSDKLADGRSFRILTVVTRERVCLEADRSMTGTEVAQTLEGAKHERGSLPKSITVDSGSEFCSRAQAGGERIHREFQRAVADECLNVEWFSSLDDARQKLAKFREHYNHQRPHSAVGGPYAHRLRG